MSKKNHKTASPAQARVMELRIPSVSNLSAGGGSFESFISDNVRDLGTYTKVNASSEWSSFMKMVNK